MAAAFCDQQNFLLTYCLDGCIIPVDYMDKNNSVASFADKLSQKKANNKGRVNIYLGLPNSLNAPCKRVMLQSGVGMADILRDAIPSYLEGGVDSSVLKAWELQDAPQRSDVYTSIPHELHEKCVEVSTRDGVPLAAVFRAALAYVFEIEPDRSAEAA